MDLSFLVLVGTTVATLNYANGGCCPDAWVSFQESCYFFDDEIQLDWTEATHHCATLGGHLVTIESAEENLFIRAQANRYLTHVTGQGDSFWMGATDEEIEGLWVWYTDHSKIDTTIADWNPGEPDDVSNQDCGLILGLWHYKWGDSHCDAKFHIICEKTIAGSSEIVG